MEPAGVRRASVPETGSSLPWGFRSGPRGQQGPIIRGWQALPQPWRGSPWSIPLPGDRIFSALGLPVWSQGTTGTHYPGLAGLAAAMAGIAVVNTTLGEKVRIRVWTIVVVILVLDMVRAALG